MNSETTFERILGFEETTWDETKDNLARCEDGLIRSRLNDAKLRCGRFSTPSLQELADECEVLVEQHRGKIKVNFVNGDVRTFLYDPTNANAVFQAASQFNCLEMSNHRITPEHGVSRYDYDNTQGPACATAALGGLLERQFFIDVRGGEGQRVGRQVNTLIDLEDELAEQGLPLWQVQNGYMMFSSAQDLEAISEWIRSNFFERYDELCGLLRYGLHQDVGINTFDEILDHDVTQVYCSAVPVSENHVIYDKRSWQPLASMVLNSAYEAMMWIGLKNYHRTGVNKIFLTTIGGGAFGNDREWINRAIIQAVEKFSHLDLEVNIISYLSPDPQLVNALRII
jgi:hypothetical protein